ncbi:MAG: orotidine 5'-phosphate decarboxylase [Propionibacteriaceae bacterium]|jgi:3-dehydro-L-gulonate-6-phosphate decarboxylase|nr:orotidine 5'-phosphate decarboxylase [Propionibacteriaceae bacterium]
MPQLQLALDTPDLPSALGPLNQAVGQVDIIECGTVLLLAEGLRAVRECRALYPDKTILADARIVEAGAVLARQCFEAGADQVTCVAGASDDTIAQVVRAAADHDGQVQVELNDHFSLEAARRWRRLGVQQAIVKRSRDAEAAGRLAWRAPDVQRVHDLAGLGFQVTITGGLTAADLDLFAGAPVAVVIVGRGIVRADDPEQAARAMRLAIRRVWP